MAVIRASESAAAVRDAIVLDLGDLRREAEAMRSKAEAEARRIVDEGRRERDRLIANASEQGREAGFAEGHAAGLEQGRAEGKEEALQQAAPEISKLTRLWKESLEQLRAERARMLLESRQDIVRFAVEFSSRVVKRIVELDATVVESQIEAALSMVLDATRLELSVHPEDAERAERILAPIAEMLRLSDEAAVVTDEAVGRGGVIVRTAHGVIDASIRGQIDRICEALLPDGVGLGARCAAGGDGSSAGRRAEPRHASDEDPPDIQPDIQGAAA